MSEDKEIKDKDLENVSGGLQKGVPGAVGASDKIEGTDPLQAGEGQIKATDKK